MKTIKIECPECGNNSGFLVEGVKNKAICDICDYTNFIGDNGRLKHYLDPERWVDFAGHSNVKIRLTFIISFLITLVCGIILTGNVGMSGLAGLVVGTVISRIIRLKMNIKSKKTTQQKDKDSEDRMKRMMDESINTFGKNPF